MFNITGLKGFDNRVEIISKRINENGYLVLECNFARIGIQERYGAEISLDFEPKKLYKEYRSPDEVFKPEVLKAFRNVVVTNDHPQGLLTPDNTRFHAIGFVSSDIQIINNTHLGCEITITDTEAIDDIQNGKVELSAGYLYSILMAENEDYDYVQIDLKPNHIALVQAGRCGISCSLALDSTLNKGKNMKKIVFKRMLPNGSEKIITEIEVEDSEAEALQTEADLILANSKSIIDAEKKQGEDDKKDEEMKSLKEEAVAKDRKIAKLEADSDTGFSKENIAKDANVQKLVKTMAHDMAGVISVAQTLGLDTADKSTCDLKKEVISRVNPALDLTGKEEAYLAFAYDNVASQLKDADASFLNGLDLEAQTALDEQDKEVDKAKSGFKSKFGGKE